jgi:ribosomal protein S18 acetylase RimI-like enzyme
VGTDLPTIAHIHAAAFQGFVLTQLGPGFLHQYYRAVLEYAEGVLMVAEREGAVVGFAAGFGHPAEFSRGLKRRILRLAPHIVVGVLTHPRVFSIVWQNSLGVLRGRNQAASVADLAEAADDAELSSLGVHPSAQRCGAGRALVGAFVEAARRLGARGVRLSTDSEDNDRVNRFYASLGFTLTASYLATGNRRRNHYRLPVQP